MSPGRPETRICPIFHVDYPVGGTFGVHVHSVSPDARLDIYLDGKLALQRELPAQDVPGKLCVWSDEWDVWRCEYDEEFTVEVPAGRHTIRVENGKPGASWLRVSAYALGNYDPEPLRAWGLRGRNTSVLWVQNKQSTWGNDRRGITPAVVRDGALVLEGFADGLHDIEWWDTWAGRPTGRASATARDGRLELPLPEIERDVACIIRGGG
jgi:hypothetical protein